MSKMFRALSLAAALAAVLPSGLAAQDEAAAADDAPTPADADALRLPADSMELGATYVTWLLDYRADSLWAHFSEGMKENRGSIGDFRDLMGEIFRQIGTQERVVSQRYWMRNGKPQFWHTAEFSQMPEPVVIRLVIEPDGLISGMGLNPESQNPPVDDPNQHGPDDS